MEAEYIISGKGIMLARCGPLHFSWNLNTMPPNPYFWGFFIWEEAYNDYKNNIRTWQ